MSSADIGFFLGEIQANSLLAKDYLRDYEKK